MNAKSIGRPYVRKTAMKALSPLEALQAAERVSAGALRQMERGQPISEETHRSVMRSLHQLVSEALAAGPFAAAERSDKSNKRLARARAVAAVLDADGERSRRETLPHDEFNRQGDRSTAPGDSASGAQRDLRA